MHRALILLSLLSCVPSPESPWAADRGSQGDCLEDRECPSGWICDQGVCSAGGCIADDQCGPNEACDHGRCLPIDEADCRTLGCPDGSVCHSQTRRCVEPLAQGCASDLDCPAGEVCDALSGGCGPAMGSTCNDDAQCPLHARCEAIDESVRRCVEFACQSDADCAVRSARCDRRTRRCMPRQGQGCEVDADCPEIDGKMGWCNRRERRCFNTEEEQFCLDDWACAEGERCDREASLCIPINSCTEDLECPPRQRCQSSRCSVARTGDPCDHDSVCPINDRCVQGRCQSP